MMILYRKKILKLQSDELLSTFCIGFYFIEKENPGSKLYLPSLGK